MDFSLFLTCAFLNLNFLCGICCWLHFSAIDRIGQTHTKVETQPLNQRASLYVKKYLSRNLHTFPKKKIYKNYAYLQVIVLIVWTKHTNSPSLCRIHKGRWVFAIEINAAMMGNGLHARAFCSSINTLVICDFMRCTAARLLQKSARFFILNHLTYRNKNNRLFCNVCGCICMWSFDYFEKWRNIGHFLKDTCQFNYLKRHGPVWPYATLILTRINWCVHRFYCHVWLEIKISQELV